LHRRAAPPGSGSGDRSRRRLRPARLQLASGSPGDGAGTGQRAPPLRAPAPRRLRRHRRIVHLAPPGPAADGGPAPATRGGHRPGQAAVRGRQGPGRQGRDRAPARAARRGPFGAEGVRRRGGLHGGGADRVAYPRGPWQPGVLPVPEAAGSELEVTDPTVGTQRYVEGGGEPLEVVLERDPWGQRDPEGRGSVLTHELAL